MELKFRRHDAEPWESLDGEGIAVALRVGLIVGAIVSLLFWLV